MPFALAKITKNKALHRKKRNDLKKIIEEKGMVVVSDTGAIENFVKEVIAENPKAIADYKNGKTNVVGWLMGQVMKKSGGKASPKTATELLKAELEKA